jgi:hypothetical protein
MTTTKKITNIKEKNGLKSVKISKKKSISQKQIENSKSPKNNTKSKNPSKKLKVINKKGDNHKENNVVKKKKIQEGGADVCSKDLNELLTGNPMVLMGNKGDIDFSKEMSAAGQSFSKDVMSSFKGVEDGWGGSPGMPPKFPSGCVLM